jgi:hypothetical protein
MLHSADRVENALTTVINFVCTRVNDGGGVPANYSCILRLVDDAILGSSGNWTTGGLSPTDIFVAQSGNWVKTVGQVTLDSMSGALSDRVIMQNADAQSGVLKGDGLVGGNIVNWTKI